MPQLPLGVNHRPTPCPTRFKLQGNVCSNPMRISTFLLARLATGVLACTGLFTLPTASDRGGNATNRPKDSHQVGYRPKQLSPFFLKTQIVTPSSAPLLHNSFARTVMAIRTPLHCATRHGSLSHEQAAARSPSVNTALTPRMPNDNPHPSSPHNRLYCSGNITYE